MIRLFQDLVEKKQNLKEKIINARNDNRGFASAGVQEKCETNGKLINFMVGVRRVGRLKPARCKAPAR
jgi:hypothetical protein